MTTQLTFRDFAMATADEDPARAEGLLAELLGVDAATASAGTEHFKTQMADDPAFMMKAMGMRTIVEARDEPGLVSRLGECFALSPEAAARAAAVVWSRYPTP
jgi:hypothetical protein